MTSKTFKSEVSQGRLSISDTRNGLFTVAVRRGGESVDMIDLKTETAPALCLAILEAAGVVPVQRDYESYDDGTPEHLQAVSYFLKQHNEAQERITAEAKEQAELEAEAVELFNAGVMTGSHSQAPHESFGHIPDYAQPKWLAVARKARELGGRAEQ